MDEELRVSFTGFLGVEEIEKALISNYALSVAQRHIHLNLEQLEWISPFGLTTLICWLYEIVQNGTARCSLPLGETFAAAFLNAVGFSQNLEALGVKVSKGSRQFTTFRKRKLAALRRFNTASDYQTYCRDLGEQQGQRLLLEIDDIPELVSSGRFHRIVLSELLDNCFTHAQGVNCHYAALEVAPSTKDRSPHPLFASFGQSGYIEVSVADSAASNLIKTLAPHLPNEYDPTRSFALERKLRDDAERTILYAFDYSSSSQPSARENKIRAWLEDYGGEVQKIATGLYENLSLARLYSGQLIVRSDGKLATIDFSSTTSNDNRPRAFFWNLKRTKRLAELRGTIITIRVPVSNTSEGNRVAPRPRPARTSKETAASALRIKILSISTNGDEADQPKKLVALEQDIAHALRDSPPDVALVACSFDQTTIPTKVLCAFVELIAHIPRFGKAFALLVEPDHFEHLVTHWSKLLAARSEEFSIISDPALILLTGTHGSCEAYGNGQHPSATRIRDGNVDFPDASSCTVEALISRLRRDIVLCYLACPPVRHGDGHLLYLIERSYYVDRFYEVRALLDNARARDHLTYWLEEQIEIRNPDAIICNVGFLRPLVNDALGRRRVAPTTQPLVLDASTQAAAALAMNVSMLSKERPQVLVFCDAIVTARMPMSFLSRYSHPEDVTVVTIMDGRGGTRDYLTYEGIDRPIQIPVVAILREHLEPIRDRPAGIKPRDVVIVDPKTHSPTRYPLPEETNVSELEILKRLDAAAAIRPGHFALGDKHFPYFAPFKTAFGSINDVIVSWLKEEHADIITDAPIDPGKLHIYCLPEGSNLDNIVAQSFPGVGRLKVLTREQVEAPPAPSPTGVQAAWFIIPALASGKTAQQILDYAASLNPRHVRVSVVLARTDPATVGFYQRIGEYAQFRTKLSFMVSVPFPWFPTAHCPVCAARHNLANLLSHDAVKSRLALRALLERAHSEARAEALTSASTVPLIWERPAEYPLWNEIYIVSLYSRSQHDLDARVRLQEQLAAESGVELLATGLGRCWTTRLFKGENTGRGIYKPEVVQSACTQWVLKQPSSTELFGFQLRGFRLLAADTLQGLLHELWKRIASNTDACRQMLVAAAQDSTYFWEAIEVATSSVPADHQEALSELKEAVQIKGFGVDEGVVLYTRLYRLLSRTGGWGQPFENLRLGISMRQPFSPGVESLLRVFLQDGFDDASGLLRQLQNTPLFKKRICHCNPKLIHKWTALVQAVTEMKNALLSRPETGLAVLNVLDSVEIARAAFVVQMESIGCRPGTVLRSIRTTAPLQMKKSQVSFQVEIGDNCRSLAIHDIDFAQIVQELLTNAAKYGAVDDVSDVRFRLDTPVDSLSFVRLEVFQSGSWLTSNKAETGLNMIRELAADYGAYVRFPLRSGTDTAVVEILFHAWPPDEALPDRMNV